MFRRRKLHWYVVRFVYYAKDGLELFDCTQNVGCYPQAKILQARELKKRALPTSFLRDNKVLLENGTIRCEVRCYLGKFAAPLPEKKREPTTIEKMIRELRTIWRPTKAADDDIPEVLLKYIMWQSSQRETPREPA